MSKNNNLVEIAKVLIEMREERALNGVPASIMARYPEGSQGIVINEDKFIVLNSNSSSVVAEDDKINTLKDNTLKYNANFYLGTHESDEPDIIDQTHNKSKLINEAYTEVSFLPKDIYSQAEFDPEEGKFALRNVIDKEHLSSKDFDDYTVEKVKSHLYSTGESYDEIYRCRCIFTDISGNESIESLLIKALRVSDVKGAEYTYKIINSENIKEQVEELENKVAQDKTGEMRSQYSTISDAEYKEIEKHIQEGIEKYYEENSKKFYRLTRVDIKAIYCLRLKKNQIKVNLLVDNTVKAVWETFYSMVSGSFNVFTCPICKALSSGSEHYDSMKIHVDHDYSTLEEGAIGSRSPIGCNSCMEYCNKCGAWHFKLSQYNNIISKGFNPMDSRRFLRHFAGKNVSSVDFCACKEYVSWVYDEMSPISRNGKIYYDRVIPKFLSNSCKLVFINSLTGEKISNYDDFLLYLYEYLCIYLKKAQNIFNRFMDNKRKATNLKDMKTQIYNFVDMYKLNQDHEFDGFYLENYIEQAINDFKRDWAQAMNTSPNFIKMTSLNQMVKCNCCGGLFFKDKNLENESYYNVVKSLCACCAQASSYKLKMWNRADDGVTFYKPKNKQSAIRTFQSKSGEIVFEDWMNIALSSMIERLKTIKD